MKYSWPELAVLGTCTYAARPPVLACTFATLPSTQARLRLTRKPVRPRWTPVIQHAVRSIRYDEWRPFLHIVEDRRANNVEDRRANVVDDRKANNVDDRNEGYRKVAGE